MARSDITFKFKIWVYVVTSLLVAKSDFLFGDITFEFKIQFLVGDINFQS